MKKLMAWTWMTEEMVFQREEGTQRVSAMGREDFKFSFIDILKKNAGKSKGSDLANCR